MSGSDDHDNKTKTLTARIEAVCARQEKSPAEVLALLKRWGAEGETAQQILVGLKAGKFVDEERYARAFVQDKVRIEHWGFVKVRLSLRGKGVSVSLADRAIKAFDQEEYRRMVRSELEKKHKLVKAPVRKAWQQLARFGAGRGYEMDIMYDMLDEICGGRW